MHRLANDFDESAVERHQSARSSAASASRSSSSIASEASLPRSRLSHSAKFGAGDSVTKVEMRGNSRRTSSTTCLIRKWPKRHAGKSALAVGDRVENRRRRAFRVDDLALVGQDRRDRSRYVAGQRHLDKNQRLVDQRRMKEGVTAPVRQVDAAPQLLPVVNFVHGLVTDDFFRESKPRSTSRCGAGPKTRD